MLHGLYVLQSYAPLCSYIMYPCSMGREEVSDLVIHVQVQVHVHGHKYKLISSALTRDLYTNS